MILRSLIFPLLLSTQF